MGGTRVSGQARDVTEVGERALIVSASSLETGAFQAVNTRLLLSRLRNLANAIGRYAICSQ